MALEVLGPLFEDATHTCRPVVGHKDQELGNPFLLIEEGFCFTAFVVDEVLAGSG